MILRNSLFVALVFTAASPVAAAAPITGKWLTPPKDSVIEIAPCGQRLCGRVAKILKPRGDGPQLDRNNPNPALRSRPIVGVAILSDFTDGGSQWTGTIYDPRNGKSYRSNVARNPDGTLKVQGCIAFFLPDADLDGGEVMLAAALLAAPASAALAQPFPPPEITQYLAKGETVETRANGDLNGDGAPDSAIVTRSEDERTLYVVLSSKGEFSLDQDLRGKGALEPYALGAAEMRIVRGVLTLKDLVGGTDATQLTYRLRYEPATKRMRLIGVDAYYYSRTWANDGAEISWNLLTGDRTRRTLKLRAPGGPYDPQPLVKSKRASKPLYVETLPDSETLAGR